MSVGASEWMLGKSSATPVAPHPFGAGMTSEAFQSLGCMEGVYAPVVEFREGPVSRAAAHYEGYVAATAVALVAYAVHLLPVAPFTVRDGAAVRHPLSAAILAILLGIVVRNGIALPGSIRPGCKHIVKRLIPVAIVLIGAGLNLAAFASVGVRVLAIIVWCMVFGVGASYAIGRWLGMSNRASLLLGAGTGICGNSAIVAVAPLVDAEDNDVLLSIGTVNLFGLVAMLCLPIFGRALGMDGDSFGVWCGTSIHAVPQVVAAGFALDTDAGTVATLVKLVRVTLLAPLVFVLALMHVDRSGSQPSGNPRFVLRYARLIPWFVWGFVGMATMNTLGLIPTISFPSHSLLSTFTDSSSASLVGLMTSGGELILTLAMAAIGLDVCLRDLGRVGSKAVVAGLVSTSALVLMSLLLITAVL